MSSQKFTPITEELTREEQLQELQKARQNLTSVQSARTVALGAPDPKIVEAISAINERIEALTKGQEQQQESQGRGK